VQQLVDDTLGDGVDEVARVGIEAGELGAEAFELAPADVLGELPQ